MLVSAVLFFLSPKNAARSHSPPRVQMRPVLPTAKTADTSVYSHCSSANYLIKLAPLTLSHPPTHTSNAFLTANR